MLSVDCTKPLFSKIVLSKGTNAIILKCSFAHFLHYPSGLVNEQVHAFLAKCRDILLLSPACPNVQMVKQHCFYASKRSQKRAQRTVCQLVFGRIINLSHLLFKWVISSIRVNTQLETGIISYLDIQSSIHQRINIATQSRQAHKTIGVLDLDILIFPCDVNYKSVFAQ